MNGQTGKMVGDLPVDKKKKSLLYWGCFAVLTSLLSFTLGPVLARFLWDLIQGMLS